MSDILDRKTKMALDRQLAETIILNGPDGPGKTFCGHQLDFTSEDLAIVETTPSREPGED